MASSGCCNSTDRHFTAARAETELRRYRRRGPTGTARQLLRLLREAQVQVETVLDVGGGVGVLHHELLGAGAGTAVHVEAAGAYVEAARGETARRGQLNRVTFRHGDVVDLAPELAPADLVTLDRVICCYPDLGPLLATTAGKARRFWAASFPRERWFIHLKTKWENGRRARAGNQFRSYVHPVPVVYSLLGAAGLAPLRVHRGVFWEVVLFSRRDRFAALEHRQING